MAGMFDRDKLANEMTHEARDDSRVTFEDIIYSLLGTTAEEAGRNREEWNRLVSNPSEIVNQLSNWPDPRAFTARESNTGRIDEVVGNVSNFIPGGMFNGGIAGVLVGPKGIKNLGRYQELIERAAEYKKMLSGAKRLPAKDELAAWRQLNPFWFGAADEIPRMEVPDIRAEIDPSGLKPTTVRGVRPVPPDAIPSLAEEWNIYEGKLGDVLDHPELYKAYPDFKDIDVVVDPYLQWKGLWRPYARPAAPGRIDIRGDIEHMKTGEARHTTLHELTHGIAKEEGMAKGGLGIGALSPDNQRRLDVLSGDLKEMTNRLQSQIDAMSLEKYGKLVADLTPRQAKVFDEIPEVVRLQNMIEGHFKKFRERRDKLIRESYRLNAGEAEAEAVARKDALARVLAKSAGPSDDIWTEDIFMPWEDFFSPRVEELFVIPQSPR